MKEIFIETEICMYGVNNLWRRCPAELRARGLSLLFMIVCIFCFRKRTRQEVEDSSSSEDTNDESECNPGSPFGVDIEEHIEVVKKTKRSKEEEEKLEQEREKKLKEEALDVVVIENEGQEQSDNSLHSVIDLNGQGAEMQVEAMPEEEDNLQDSNSSHAVIDLNSPDEGVLFEALSDDEDNLEDSPLDFSMGSSRDFSPLKNQVVKNQGPLDFSPAREHVSREGDVGPTSVLTTENYEVGGTGGGTGVPKDDEKDDEQQISEVSSREVANQQQTTTEEAAGEDDSPEPIDEADEDSDTTTIRKSGKETSVVCSAV